MQIKSRQLFNQMLLVGFVLGAGGASSQAASPLNHALQTSTVPAHTAARGEALVEPIAHFGADGAAVPAAARELLPEGFFTLSLLRGIADPGNYSAVLDLGELLAADGEAAGGQVILTLNNGARRDNDLVLVAPATGKLPDRNFLVRLAGEGERRLDISSLVGVPSLYVLSLQEFNARVEIRSGAGKARTAELTTAMPASGGLAEAKSGGGCNDQNYCTNCSQTIQISGSGGTVNARAVRAFWYTASSGHDYYKVNVQYPVAGPYFHCHYSTFASGTECKASDYTTFRPSTPGVCSVGTATAVHSWDNLDATLFQGVPSSASCLSGCSDTFTITRN
jgi:hypothetical protein